MGQTASTVDVACAQSCKDWGEKDYSTVKVDIASIRSLDCLKNEDPLPCLGKDATEASQPRGKDKEFVTDKENAPPAGFKVPKLTIPGHGETESEPVSMTASTTASVTGNSKEIKVPRLNIQEAQEPPQSDRQQNSQDFQWSIIDSSRIEHTPTQQKVENIKAMDAEQQLLAADLAESQTQPECPKAWTSERDAAAFELKVTRMGWSQSEHSLVRREVIAIPSSANIHPDLKISEFKTMLKDQKMTLKNGEAINTDDMVLTTPRELAVGAVLEDRKTLAESGVGPKTPELLLLHTESVRKASCSGRKASPSVSTRKTNEQWLEVEHKKLEAKAKKEQEVAEQRMKVDSWLRSNGFKDVNEMIRKRLTKARPLHVAVGKGDAEMVRLLLITGADPRMCNGKTETPLLMAKRLERSGSPGSASVVGVLEKCINEGFS